MSIADGPKTTLSECGIDILRLLDYLKVRQQGYGSALAFHLANALFQTACRFEELIQLRWSDCQRVGEEIVALRIKGR
jgi:integrase